MRDYESIERALERLADLKIARSRLADVADIVKRVSAAIASAYEGLAAGVEHECAWDRLDDAGDLAAQIGQLAGNAAAALEDAEAVLESRVRKAWEAAE